MTTIFHIELKPGGHHYYGGLSALIEAGHNIGVSESKLQKFPFDEKHFENRKCIIRKGAVFTANEVRRRNGR